MLDLNALKEALAPLSKIGRDEMTFETGGMQLTLRPLLPMEEVAVQRYAASVLDKIQTDEGLNPTDQMSRAAALDYFDRFRIEIIAYALIQIDDLDLREVKTIPTGETVGQRHPCPNEPHDGDEASGLRLVPRHDHRLFRQVRRPRTEDCDRGRQDLPAPLSLTLMQKSGG